MTEALHRQSRETRAAPALGAGRALPGVAPRAGHPVGWRGEPRPTREKQVPGLRSVISCRSAHGTTERMDDRA